MDNYCNLFNKYLQKSSKIKVKNIVKRKENQQQFISISNS